MGDDKKEKKDPCVPMGKFELKICPQEEEKKPKPKPTFDWKIVTTLAVATGLGLQLAGNGSSDSGDIDSDEPTIASLDSPETLSPTVVVPSETAPDVLVVPDASPSVVPSLELLTLNTLDSVETLPSAIQQAIATGNVEAIALLFTEGEYWVGDVTSPLDMQTVAASDSLILSQIEEAIATGCVSNPPTDESATDESATAEVLYWVCPGLAEVAETTSLASSNTVLIDGTDVNIRRAPSVESEVITALSYQILPIDQSALEAFSEEERFALDIGSGWCPVELAEGDVGYVASEFCRPIQQNHTLLRLLDGMWQVTIATP